MGYGFLFTYFSPRQPYKTHQELGAMEAIRTMPNNSAPKSSLAPKRKVSWVTPVLHSSGSLPQAVKTRKH